MESYYTPCKEFDACNELIERYWKTGQYEQCFRGHLQLAEKGYPLAECQVGYFYLEGIGVQKNLEKAFYWTERAAQHGDRDAQFNLGWFYENGIVVAKDLEQFCEGLVIGNLDRVALVSFIDRILIYDDFRVEIVFKYRQEMEKVTGLFDVVNEKDAEPVYTMVDGLPVLELKEAV